MKYQLFHDETKTWTEAKAFCEARGAMLATPHSDQEVEELAKLTIDYNDYWIGGRCVGNSYQVTTGIFETMQFMRN